MSVEIIKNAIKKMCQEHMTLEGLNVKKIEPSLIALFEKYKNKYHHIEYDVTDKFVEVRLFTKEDDGYVLKIDAKVKKP